MALNPLYAVIEFYVSLVTYTVLHMIFVISSDFVEAFNIPPLNIGIYVDKLAAIRALLMVIADILEWLITQEYLHDPGAYSKLSGNGHRRQGSVFSFFVMWLCRLIYLWLVYKSDNKSLTVFITLCIEGFWFGVFQMSFFAIGPEYNAFTSLAIHAMGNFIFFTQVILNKLSKKYPSINSLSRVRVHAWVCLVTSTISLGPWIWFCDQYIKGDTTEYKALRDEPYWFETGSFNDLVTALKTKLETDLKSEDNPDASKVANKIREALKDTSVKPKITSVLQKDFGIEGEVNVEGSTNVEVKIKGGTRQQGMATVNVEKTGESDKKEVTIQVMDNGTEAQGKGEKIAKRLAKASALAASWVPNLAGFTVKSDSETANDVKKYLTQKLRDAGSEKFKALVDQLKSQPGFSSSDDLNKDKLREALNKDDVKVKIKALLEEFSVTVSSTSNINATPGTSGENKVTVMITGTGSGSEHKGFSLVKQNPDKKIQNPIDIEVQFKNGVTGADADKAEKFTHRLVRAVETAKFGTNSNLVEALVKAEFAITQDVKVKPEPGGGDTVEVHIGTGSNPQHTETVNVDSQTITIQVKGNDSDIGKAAARRVARRLSKTLIDFGFPPKNKFKGFEIKMDPIRTENVWSPFLLFIVGAFAEDFAVPGVLPFAFLDPEKANLVNYLTPLFFFTGAFIILLLDSIFSGEQSVLKEATNDIRILDSQFKEWSEGAAPGWHGMWFFNVPKYIAFFISMWSIHGTFGDLRCIIQSRWRVLLLTMFIVVPRATLEVAGYVGVANFAIGQGETGDYYGFKFIAWHDMIAMFCRFVYGKFAVGYN